MNLKHQTEFVKKAPLIESSTEAGNVLTVEGYFFGSSGELYVDDSLLATTSYSDSKVTADLSNLGLSNGSHVVKIVNADGAAMCDLFSYSGSDSENGRPLFENTLSLPLSKPAFITDASARLYGQMAVCDGSLYAMAVDEQSEGIQALWRYDIAENWWSRCADLPDELKGRETSGDALVALGGFVYAYGNDIIENSVLWRYDPDADAWNKVDAPIPSKSTLCVHDGKLFFLGGYFGNVFEDLPEDEDVTFALLDLDAEELIKLDMDGVAPDGFDESNANVASSNKYMYWYCPSYDGQAGYLGRLAYDEASAKVSVTDMTDTLKKANAYNLLNEAHKGDLDYPIEHIKLARLPYGVAYKVTSNKVNAVALVEAKAAKTFKVASTIKIKGKTYKVTAIGPKAFSVAKKKLTKLVVGKNVASVGKQAFAGCAKLKKLIVASKKLTKKGVKGSLKGSKIKIVQVKVGSKKANKKYAKKYKKIFTKKNCGKKVKVK